jgi:hypothetical protein
MFLYVSLTLCQQDLHCERYQENAEMKFAAQQERFQAIMTAFTMGIAAFSRVLPTTQPQESPSNPQ